MIHGHKPIINDIQSTIDHLTAEDIMEKDRKNNFDLDKMSDAVKHLRKAKGCLREATQK